jgi:hypothetical protein
MGYDNIVKLVFVVLLGYALSQVLKYINLVY